MEALIAMSECEQYVGFCPCGEKLDEYSVENYEYTTHPMIWCDSCGGRYFLDCEEYDRAPPESEIGAEREIVLERYRTAGKLIHDNRELQLYRIPLCFVERVSGSDMTRVSSTRKLSEDEIGSLQELGIFSLRGDDQVEDPRALADIMQKLGVKYVVDEGDRHYGYFSYMKENNIPHVIGGRDSYLRENIMVRCDSYNVEEGQQPKWVDLSHDGVVVACQILHRGKPRIALYWGD